MKIMISILLAMASVQAALATPSLRHERSETFTGEVSSIALSPKRVWVASSGGLAVHDRGDGHHLFTLTAAQGLLGNRLNALALVDSHRLLIGSDFGLTVASWKQSPTRVEEVVLTPIRRSTTGDYFDPIFALPRVEDQQFALAHQSALTAVKLGDRNPSGQGKRGPAGMWRSACAGSMGLLAGSMNGRIAKASVQSPGQLETWVELSQPVLALACLDSQVLIATGAELHVLGPSGLRLLRDRAAPEHGVPALSLSQDAMGAWWIGSGDGRVLRYHLGDLDTRIQGLGDRVTALAMDGIHAWIGLGRRGLHRVHLDGAGQAQALRPPGEICDNHISHLTRFAGLLVAASFDQGVCVQKKGRWTSLRDLPSPLIHGVAHTAQYLYVATSNGLARYDRHFVFRPFGNKDAPMLRWFASLPSTAAARIGAREVAVASPAGVLRILDRHKRPSRVRYLSHQRGVPFAISSVAGRRGDLYVASERQGVAVFDRRKQLSRRFRDPDHLPEAWVTALAIDAQQTTWVATCQSGLAVIGPQGSRTLDRSTGLADDRVIALAATQGGAFVGTLGGLSWVSRDTEQLASFGLSQGLPDLRISSLWVESGRLWVATESGMSSWRIESAHPALGKSSLDEHVQHSEDTVLCLVIECAHLA